ncbi:hypothetical protein [Agrobacterium cavarae]
MLKVELFQVAVHELRGRVNPLGGTLWGCAPIREGEVTHAVAQGELEGRHWDGVKDELHGPNSRDFHIRRIAFFVENGLPDDDYRIRLAIDATDRSPIRIDNGNHRLAAAFIRDDPTVKALLYYFDGLDVDTVLPNARRIGA